ncbi:MAG: hypothetical protein QXP36_00505 [Conexivisphaerales archaeon]
MAAAVVAEELLVPADRGETPEVSPAVLEALETLGALLTPIEAALSTILPQGDMLAALSPIPFGFSFASVFVGPPPFAARAREFLAPFFPIYEAARTHAIVVDAEQEEWGDVAKRYGVSASVSVLADVPSPAYIVECTSNEELGRLLLKALRLRPASGGARIEIPGTKITVKRS